MGHSSLVKIPDAYSQYANFKHRLWFTWHIWYITQRRPRTRRGPPWFAIICGADSNGDLWLWEDMDEECIKEFAEDLSLDPFPEMPVIYWSDACRALEARRPRTTAYLSPLAHLTPQTRLRFIAWLIVAGPVRKDQILREGDFPSLEISITRWGTSMSDTLHSADSDAEYCDICGVSHLLSSWVETMLKIYSLDDLRSIPWYHACGCWERHLYAISHSGQRGPTQKRLEKDSAALRVLYELVVSPWPLTLWVNFRTVVNNRTDVLQLFLDILRGPDEDLDLFTRDDDDDSDLYQVLVKENQLGLYPCEWGQYMVEIDLKTWLQISNLTWTAHRPCRGLFEDMKIRLAAVTLRYSLTLTSSENILAPLDVYFDHFPFTTMAYVVDKNYKERSTVVDFESEEFWASLNLENWLSARNEVLCHAVWHTSSRISVLERVQCMHLVLTALPQSLAMYAYSLILQQPNRDRGLHAFQELGDCAKLEFLDSLKRYYSDVEILLAFVKQSIEVNHIISTKVYEHLNRDIFAVVARLVLLLRDPEAYKQFLACRGTDAQKLLDLLQDLLDLESFSVVKPLIFKALLRLSRASGLHPRCFVLPELQKVGQQVAAGGFGDLWKGLVRGHSVSVKVMRIFRNAHVEGAIKEFSREALIWRQLSHPNVLPFFGLYYLENRLCLVSPWMENGNMMEFLTNENPDLTDRFSLILDVALGLQYLHEKNVVHGDLKAINVLVTPSRTACIADFGLSSIANAMTLRFTHSTANVQGGTARYQAPELLRGESQHYGSDVYGFTCVCYEILTGKVPFHEFLNDMTVILQIIEGKRPTRPVSCSGIPALESLWELLQNCWEDRAEMRPTAPQIVKQLIGPLIRAKTTSSMTEWDDKFTSKFRRSLQAQSLLPSVSQIDGMFFSDDILRSNLARPQGFPGRESSDLKNEEGFSELRRQPKRRYEEEDSNTDRHLNAPQQRVKKQKNSPEIASV